MFGSAIIPELVLTTLLAPEMCYYNFGCSRDCIRRYSAQACPCHTLNDNLAIDR